MKTSPAFSLTAIALGLAVAQQSAAQQLEEVVVTAQQRTESMPGRTYLHGRHEWCCDQ